MNEKEIIQVIDGEEYVLIKKSIREETNRLIEEIIREVKEWEIYKNGKKLSSSS